MVKPYKERWHRGGVKVDLTQIDYDSLVGRIPHQRSQKILTTLIEEDVVDKSALFLIADNIYVFNQNKELTMFVRNCWKENCSYLYYLFAIIKTLFYNPKIEGFVKKVRFTGESIEVILYREEWFKCLRNTVLREDS